MVYTFSQPHEFPEFNSNVIAHMLIQLLIVSKNPQLSNFAMPYVCVFGFTINIQQYKYALFRAKIAIFSLSTNKT